jgi:hypothetical protein
MASAKSKPGSGPQGFSIGHFFLLLVVIVVCVFPFYWMVTTSFKEQSAILSATPQLFFHPTLGNYTTAFQKFDIGASLVNSLIVALSTTAISLILGVPDRPPVSTTGHPTGPDPDLSDVQCSDRRLDLRRPIPEYPQGARRGCDAGGIQFVRDILADCSSSGCSRYRSLRHFQLHFLLERTPVRTGAHPVERQDRPGGRNELSERLRTAMGPDHGDRHFGRVTGHYFQHHRLAPTGARTDHGRDQVGVQRSTFNVQRSTFSVQRSAFNVQRSAFGVRRLAFGVWRAQALFEPPRRSANRPGLYLFNVMSQS